MKSVGFLFVLFCSFFCLRGGDLFGWLRGFFVFFVWLVCFVFFSHNLRSTIM